MISTKKLMLYAHTDSFYLEFGWFSGNEWELLHIGIFETFSTGKFEYAVSVFHFQFLKLILNVGFEIKFRKD